jgi:hypothetical protein
VTPIEPALTPVWTWSGETFTRVLLSDNKPVMCVAETLAGLDTLVSSV